MSKILITGGTGFVNSFLAASLIQRGDVVYFLARSSKNCKAEERISKALILAGIEDPSCYTYYVIEADLLQENLGISAEQLLFLKSQHIDEIIHGAGSVNFYTDKEDSIFNANFLGTKRMAHLSESLGIKSFHYVGTAYAAENENIFDHIKNKRISNISCYNNQYECSKSLASTFISEWGLRNKIRVIIYEPSIIAGHSITGKAFNFSAFYTCLQTYDFLKTKILGNGRCEIKVPGHVDAKINIITIDYFIDLFLLIREFSDSGKYKIINEAPPSYSELQAMCLSFYDIKHVEISNNQHAYVYFNDQADKPLGSFLERSMSAYFPYISRSFNFNMGEAKQLLGDRYKPQVRINQHHIHLFASFAKDNNFNLSV